MFKNILPLIVLLSFVSINTPGFAPAAGHAIGKQWVVAEHSNQAPRYAIQCSICGKIFYLDGQVATARVMQRLPIG